MTYTYSLEEKDYLTHQLFLVSISRPMMFRRRKSWVLVSLLFGFMAFTSYNAHQDFLVYYFGILFLLAVFLYPRYSAWKYMRHYRRHIREQYSQNFGIEVSVSFEDQEIVTRDAHQSESRIKYPLIEALYELPGHFLIKLKTGQALILPREKLEDPVMLKKDLLEGAAKAEKVLENRSNWKWN